MYDALFFISNDVVTMLKLYLKDLARNGFDVVSGDNVALVVHWVLIVSV